MPYDVPYSKFLGASRIINSDEVYEAGITPGEKRLTPYPVPILEISLSKFSVDCFILEAVTFVSERFRDALKLSESEVEYYPIDSSRSAKSIIDADFKVLNVIKRENISLDAKIHDKINHQDIMSNKSYAGSYKSSSIDVFRKTKSSIFHDTIYKGNYFCTDDLAVKILENRCSGVRFLDPRFKSLNNPMRFRTLRGVEQEGPWDPNNNIEHTVLIERI